MKNNRDLSHSVVDLADHMLMLAGLVRGLVDALAFDRSRKLTQAGIIWNLALNSAHTHEIRMKIFGSQGQPITDDPEKLAEYLREIQLYIFGELINTFPQSSCKKCGADLRVYTHRENHNVSFCNLCDDSYCTNCMIEHYQDPLAHPDS